mgnify:CR=1 FL=1
MDAVFSAIAVGVHAVFKLTLYFPSVSVVANASQHALDDVVKSTVCKVPVLAPLLNNNPIVVAVKLDIVYE